MDALRREPSRGKGIPVQVPGDPEKAYFRERSMNGIPVPENFVDQMAELADRYGIVRKFV